MLYVEGRDMAAPRGARCTWCMEPKNEFFNDSTLCTDCYNENPLCLECGKHERNIPNPRCEDCHQLHIDRPVCIVVQDKERVLKRIKEYSDTFRDVLRLFVDRWDRRKSQCPEITAAYFIENKALQARYNEYKKRLMDNMKDPNETILFHGTVLDCDLLSRMIECSGTNCGICGISQDGFDESRIGYNIPRFQRFGSGIYLAPNSSKCHDYTQGSYGVRAMLVCKVALGKQYITTASQPNLMAAPHGFDSVHGKNFPQGALNYDEVVVYCSEAILPTYIIVYKRDGIGKIAK